jgi:peroxidase
LLICAVNRRNWRQGNGKGVLGTSLDDVFDFGGLTAAPTGIVYVSTGSGNDIVIGSNFADTLNGGLGNDKLYGGVGNDRFDFDGNFGNDTIFDFTYGSGVGDVVNFGPGVFANFAAVQAAMTQIDADFDGKFDDTRIAVGVDSVILLNVLNAKLVADDFDLV